MIIYSLKDMLLQKRSESEEVFSEMSEEQKVRVLKIAVDVASVDDTAAPEMAQLIKQCPSHLLACLDLSTLDSTSEDVLNEVDSLLNGTTGEFAAARIQALAPSSLVSLLRDLKVNNLSAFCSLRSSFICFVQADLLSR